MGFGRSGDTMHHGLALPYAGHRICFSRGLFLYWRDAGLAGGQPQLPERIVDERRVQ
jgi:hypothetical protein